MPRLCSSSAIPRTVVIPALASEVAARKMPKGPERIEALKQAGRLRMAADRKRKRFAPLGRRPKRGLQGPISITR
jgi:hypothetical protein